MGSGWYERDTLEDAKREWAFGRMVFEVPKKDVVEVIKELKVLKGNTQRIEKMKEKYSLVYEESEG